MLLIGRPSPILGCGAMPASRSGSLSCVLIFDCSVLHGPICSATVAFTPLELAERSAPSRVSSMRVALRTWEKEKRSEGDFIRADDKPPPIEIDFNHSSRRVKWCPTLVRYSHSNIVLAGNDRGAYRRKGR